jgi:hypothetical protein
VIFPPPASKWEFEVPEAAIDRTTYPPYRLVWCLEVFDKKDERLSAEIVLENFDVKALRRIFRRPPSDLMIGGGWHVTGRYRHQIEMLTGRKLKLQRYDYFVAASALNYSEVNRKNV